MIIKRTRLGSRALSKTPIFVLMSCPWEASSALIDVNEAAAPSTCGRFTTGDWYGQLLGERLFV